MGSTFLRTVLASSGMAAAVRAGVWATEAQWRGGTLVCALVVAVGLALGVGLTWAFYRLARVEELPELESAMAGLGRKLGIRF